MRYLGRLLCLTFVMTGLVGCSGESPSADAEPNISSIDQVHDEPSPTETVQPSPAKTETSSTDERIARDLAKENRELCLGTMEQINGFSEVLEDVDGSNAQLKLGPGLVDVALGIEELVEESPNADASETALAYASFFRGYGEDMEAVIGNPSEYADVMTQMMEAMDSAEIVALREDFLTACGAASD